MSYYNYNDNNENNEQVVEPTPDPVVEPAAQSEEPTAAPTPEVNNTYYNGASNNSYYNSSNSNYDNGGKKKKSNKVPFIIGGVILGIATLAVMVSIFIQPFENKTTEDIFDKIENYVEDEVKFEDIGQTEVETNTNNEATGIIMTDVSGMVENVMPSVVAITSTTVQEMYGNDYYSDIFDFYFGGGFGGGYGDDYSETYEDVAAGSGIIIDQNDTELLVVTNNHVVEGADELSIRFYGQSDDEGVVGYIKGTSPEKDVAVVAIKLKDIPKEVLNNIKKATIGDSDDVKVGEGVIAIGNALGYGQSVTMGIISAKDRVAFIEDQEMTLLQTDAAINGGNSGGALINAKGEVIGINVAKYSSSGYDTASIEGMGFAIPISSVEDIIGELENMKTREEVVEEKRGYLGIVAGYDVNEEISENYHMPIGVFIEKVVEGSPADKAGIYAQDILRKFDGQSIETFTELKELMQYYSAGEKVMVTIAYRDGREYTEKDVEVTLGDASAVEELETE